MLEPTEKPQLTARQQSIYDFIKDKIVNRGYGPTVREIGDEFGIRSPNGAVVHLKALEKKGFITRQDNKARGIKLTEESQKRMSLPLSGVLAGGKPIGDVEKNQRVDFANLFDNDDHYCLRVKNDSFALEHICEGDFVVVKKQSHCREGETVVATLDGNVEIARLYRDEEGTFLNGRSGSVRGEIEILGVVVGVVRTH